MLHKAVVKGRDGGGGGEPTPAGASVGGDSCFAPKPKSPLLARLRQFTRWSYATCGPLLSSSWEADSWQSSATQFMLGLTGPAAHNVSAGACAIKTVHMWFTTIRPRKACLVCGCGQGRTQRNVIRLWRLSCTLRLTPVKSIKEDLSGHNFSANFGFDYF